MAIVTIPELGDSLPHLLQVAEDAAVDGLLLQRPVEAFGHAVGLRFGNKGETLVDTQNSTCFRKSSAVCCVP